MRKVEFSVVGVPLMEDILFHGIMEKLQSSYPKHHDDFVEVLGIDLNWIIHQLIGGKRRHVKIMMGIIRLFKFPLLDGITTSPDICVTKDLLCWSIK